MAVETLSWSYGVENGSGGLEQNIFHDYSNDTYDLKKIRAF